jgi:uncharacterized protein YbjT (DUF2867 family)
MASLRRILVTGATGKQGGSLINALVASPPNPPFHLVALTRKANAARAQALAQKPNVSVLEGDLDDCNAIFKGQEPFHGVFSVTTPIKSEEVEERQGKALVDAAAAHGVKHFVFTSADRGVNGDTDPTPVPHFQSKFNIEEHLKNVAAETGRMDWTIIRPVAFMENLSPDFIGKAFATMWELNGMDRKLQLVSTVDVGIMAAHVFKSPEEYVSKQFSLATDSLSPNEAQAIFKRVVGKDMPTTYHSVGSLLKWMLHKQLGIMFQWFVDIGFGADPKEYKSKYPEMQDFESWLKQSSSWKH